MQCCCCSYRQHHLVGKNGTVLGRWSIWEPLILYVITSHVASAAGRMGLMAGNRLSVKPRRYYRGLFARCARPGTLILTTPSSCPQPSSLAALARQLSCATFSCLRLPVGKADTASCSCASPSLDHYTKMVDRWLQEKRARLRGFSLWAMDALCIHRRQPSTRQLVGSPSAAVRSTRSKGRLPLRLAISRDACNHGPNGTD